MTAMQAKRLKAVHHVVHEYANFVSSAEMVQSGKDINGKYFEPPINTHVSHAFYLNCRKLSDFFRNVASKHGDNIMARHFVTRFTASLPVCRKWRDPMNKQLAHVDYARDTNAREIDRKACGALYKELKTTWRRFRRRLREPYKSEFARKIKERKAPFPDGTPSEFRFYDLD
jgi:hypothetical protein